ncbi:MAG: signal peptide peptidase SppA [Acidobacteria bacterium]|nr:signal peptide peptidase SppA [Acidobacteriota bacterium]
MKKRRSYLELSLKDEIVEGQPEYSIFSRKSRTALHDVLETLNRASGDPKVVALYLTLESLDPGWARLSDMRRALVSFRKSGKPIYCYMQEGGNAEYYLASACNHIFMPPAAHLNLVGLSAEVFFLRDILDRFGINAQLQAIGEYKSAAEMFTRTGMSAPAREQVDLLLDDSYEELLHAFQDRGFSREQVAAMIDAGPYTAREAFKQKLLDGICYQDEMADKLKEAFGKKVRAITAHKYFKGDGFFKLLFTFRRPRIAVIEVLGHIDTGESRRSQAGSSVAGEETIRAFLDHAKESRRVRAIILRVNSPGGSGLASDLIWRKISIVNKTKPVVVSFGDVAASGGYYIATPASCILAEPTSVTGSIGVLAGKFVVRELLNRLSIRRESVQRGLHAEHDSPFSDFTQSEAERLHQQILEFYREDFVRKVADGRKLNDGDVDQVGRGRVWSGIRARQHKLIDEIGGFLEAVQKARELAHIPPAKKTRVVHYYRHRKLWERFMPDFRFPIMAKLLPHSALDAVSMLEQLGKQAVLLVMPFRIRIR